MSLNLLLHCSIIANIKPLNPIGYAIKCSMALVFPDNKHNCHAVKSVNGHQEQQDKRQIGIKAHPHQRKLLA